MLPIGTERLELRDFRTEDWEALHSFASDPLVTRFLSWGPNDEEATRRFIRLALEDQIQEFRKDFKLAVVDRKSGWLIGSCGLVARRDLYKEYEIGYCFHQKTWGRGLGGETVKALVSFGFSRLGAHRIFALVDPENEASAHLLTKLGFRLEGHQKKDTFVRGEWRDSFVYAILDEEWDHS